MRTALCNVIASAAAEVMADELAHSPESERRPLRQVITSIETADVPGEDYPAHWTRYESIALSAEELEYTETTARECLAQLLA